MSQLTAPEPGLSGPDNSTGNLDQEAGSESGGRKLERQLFLALLGGTLLLVGGLAKLLGMSDAVSDIPAAIGAIMLVLPFIAQPHHSWRHPRVQILHHGHEARVPDPFKGNLILCCLHEPAAEHRPKTLA